MGRYSLNWLFYSSNVVDEEKDEQDVQFLCIMISMPVRDFIDSLAEGSLYAHKVNIPSILYIQMFTELTRKCTRL